MAAIRKPGYWYRLGEKSDGAFSDASFLLVLIHSHLTRRGLEIQVVSGFWGLQENLDVWGDLMGYWIL